MSLQEATVPSHSEPEVLNPQKVYMDGLEAEGFDVDMLGNGDLEAQGWNTTVSGGGSGGAVIFGTDE